MYNGIKEDKQAMLDHMCAAIMEMRANGSEKSNHIIELKLIEITEDIKRWYGWQLKGEYVRVIWSDNPDRNDGYYDVNVTGDSALGVFHDVWKFVGNKIG